jgi:hypothetical protein
MPETCGPDADPGGPHRRARLSPPAAAAATAIPAFLVTPGSLRVALGPCPGGANRAATPVGRPGRGGENWTIGSDDGYAQLWPACRVSCLDPALRLWPGVRRAGLARLSGGADAGPGAAQRRRLI